MPQPRLFSFNNPVRRVRRLPRVREHHRARHEPRRAGRLEIDPRQRDRAVEQAALSRAARRAEARGQGGRPAPGRPVEGSDRRGEAVRRRGRRRRVRGREGVLPLARAEEVQGPRPRVPEPIPRLPDVPGLPRRAAAARGTRRQGRRADDRSGVRAHGARRGPLLRRPDALGEGRGGGRQGHEGDPQAAGVPARRRAGLPDARPTVVDAVGRRIAAHQPGDIARVGAGRHAVRPRRAVDRPPLARQRAADRGSCGSFAIRATPSSSSSTMPT